METLTQTKLDLLDKSCAESNSTQGQYFWILCLYYCWRTASHSYRYGLTAAAFVARTAVLHSSMALQPFCVTDGLATVACTVHTGLCSQQCGVMFCNAERTFISYSTKRPWRRWSRSHTFSGIIPPPWYVFDMNLRESQFTCLRAIMWRKHSRDRQMDEVMDAVPVVASDLAITRPPPSINYNQWTWHNKNTNNWHIVTTM